MLASGAETSSINAAELKLRACERRNRLLAVTRCCQWSIAGQNDPCTDASE